MGLGHFYVLCFIKVKLSVKVRPKLFVPLLCVCAILPGKTIPEMTYIVSGGMLNPTHSLGSTVSSSSGSAADFGTSLS